MSKYIFLIAVLVSANSFSMQLTAARNFNVPNFAPTADVDFDQESEATTIFDHGDDMDNFDKVDDAFEHMAAFLNLFNK